MLTLSIIYCVISFPFWLPFSLGDQFPNCVSGRFDSEQLAVGALSHKRLSTVFVTTANLEPRNSIWSERRDGHFCTFDIPTTEFLHEPAWFKVHVSPETIGWHCPYFLMIAVWAFTFYRFRNPEPKWSLSALVGITSLIAVVLALIQLRMQLICVVAMNVATLLLGFAFVFEAARKLFAFCITGFNIESN